MFYSTFLLNWRAFEDQLVRIDMLQDANAIMEQVSVSGRGSYSVQVAASGNDRTARFELVNGGHGGIRLYRITSDGTLQVEENGVTTALAHNVDFSKSAFTITQGALAFTLALEDVVFGQTVTVTSSTEVFPRCIACH
jgi:hypothetical protein